MVPRFRVYKDSKLNCGKMRAPNGWPCDLMAIVAAMTMTIAEHVEPKKVELRSARSACSPLSSTSFTQGLH